MYEGKTYWQASRLTLTLTLKGPAPRSPLHRLAVRLPLSGSATPASRSNTSTVPSTRSRGLLNCRK